MWCADAEEEAEDFRAISGESDVLVAPVVGAEFDSAGAVCKDARSEGEEGACRMLRDGEEVEVPVAA